MTCGYCLRDTHERDVCPWERLDKMRPEYERAQEECQRDQRALRTGGKYTPSSAAQSGETK